MYPFIKMIPGTVVFWDWGGACKLGKERRGAWRNGCRWVTKGFRCCAGRWDLLYGGIQDSLEDFLSSFIFFLFIVILNPHRDRQTERERDMDVREKHQLVAFSYVS